MDELESRAVESGRFSTFKNGAVYDHDKKQIVSGAVLSSDKARELVGIREQKRRQIAREAANAAVQRGDFTEKYGDDAYFVEIVHAAQQKATNIDDPKMIEAARFVLAATGESIDGSQGDGNVPWSEVRGAFRGIAEIARAIESARKVE